MRFLILFATVFITSVYSRIFSENNVEKSLINMLHPKKKNKSTEPFEDFRDDNAQDLNFPKKSIFFIQPVFNEGLDCRQSCSIEAAARVHPHFQINVFLSGGDVTKDIIETRPVTAILHYENIHFFRVKLAEYVKGYFIDSAEVECLVKKNKRCPNLFKYLTLNKYPGIYVDLDTLVLKPLDTLPDANWIGQEDDDILTDGLISFSADEIGRRMANITLSVLEDNINGGDFHSNDIVERALDSICSVSSLTKEAQRICDGFKIYSKTYFQKITMSNFEKYFATGMLNTSNVYSIRVRNPRVHSRNTPTENLRETLHYVLIARDYCPMVNKLCNVHYVTNVKRTKLPAPILNSMHLNKTKLPIPKPSRDDGGKARISEIRDEDSVMNNEEEFWQKDSFGLNFFS